VVAADAAALAAAATPHASANVLRSFAPIVRFLSLVVLIV
jgi:hypothetical protein